MNGDAIKLEGWGTESIGEASFAARRIALVSSPAVPSMPLAFKSSIVSYTGPSSI